MKKRTKLADLLSEHAFDRKFGEPNPTIEDTMNSYNKKSVNEATQRDWEIIVDELLDIVQEHFGDMEAEMDESLQGSKDSAAAKKSFNKITSDIEGEFKRLKAFGRRFK